MAHLANVEKHEDIVAFAESHALKPSVFDTVWLTITGLGTFVSVTALVGERHEPHTLIWLAVLFICVVFGLPVLFQTIARRRQRRQRTPLLIVEDDRIFDRRQNGEPIRFDNIIEARILYSGRFGAIGVELQVDNDTVRPSSLFRIACSKLVLLPWHRRGQICIPCTSLDRPHEDLAFAIASRLKSAGIPVVTKSPWYLVSKTHD